MKPIFIIFLGVFALNYINVPFVYAHGNEPAEEAAAGAHPTQIGWTEQVSGSHQGKTREAVAAGVHETLNIETKLAVYKFSLLIVFLLLLAKLFYPGQHSLREKISDLILGKKHRENIPE